MLFMPNTEALAEKHAAEEAALKLQQAGGPAPHPAPQKA
jgi:hypothetical protein